MKSEGCEIMKTTTINNLKDLLMSISENNPQILVLEHSILSPYSLTLPKGYQLIGKNKTESTLSFQFGDGLALNGNNKIANLTVLCQPNCRAIYLQSGENDLEDIILNDIVVVGQVSLILRAGNQKINILADNVHVAFADTRHYSEQPQKYNVNVYQGAFTIYNFNADSNAGINATLTNISIGEKHAPCYGSGIFICGFSSEKSTVQVEKLTTGAIYSNGLLPYGTADVITAGVFIVYGVTAKYIEHNGEVTTYGVNDMVLDTWGIVNEWICNKPIISYGPSGVGFVNFGTVKRFRANDAVITYGLGARGFNQYDGTVDEITFKSITTWGDGSVGIQISKPVGKLMISENITTHGGVGNTLVKGVLLQLPAYAISIKEGGAVDSLNVLKDIKTVGDGICALSVDKGTIDILAVGGKIIVEGKDSIGVELTEDSLNQENLNKLNIVALLGSKIIYK